MAHSKQCASTATAANVPRDSGDCAARRGRTTYHGAFAFPCWSSPWWPSSCGICRYGRRLFSHFFLGGVLWALSSNTSVMPFGKRKRMLLSLRGIMPQHTHREWTRELLLLSFQRNFPPSYLCDKITHFINCSDIRSSYRESYSYFVVYCDNAINCSVIWAYSANP